MQQAKNAKEATAKWWLRFVRIVCGLTLEDPSQFERLLVSELETMTADGEGKLRLYYRPDDGLPLQVKQVVNICLPHCQFTPPEVWVMMEFSHDYVHVTVNDQEELVWRKPGDEEPTARLPKRLPQVVIVEDERTFDQPGDFVISAEERQRLLETFWSNG